MNLRNPRDLWLCPVESPCHPPRSSRVVPVYRSRFPVASSPLITFFCPRRRLSLCLCLCLCLSLCLSLYGLSVSLRVRHRRPHLSQRAPLRYSPLSTRSSLSSKMRNYESACFTCAGGLVKVQRRDETRRDETQCLYLSLNARALEPVRSPSPSNLELNVVKLYT